MFIPRQPTYESAGAAGAISAITLSPIDWWLNRADSPLLGWRRDVIWLLALVVLFAVPFYLCVMGREPIVRSRFWIFDPEQRAGAAPFAKRSGVWILSAFCVGVVVGIANLALGLYESWWR
jgi:hypothetical protein